MRCPKCGLNLRRVEVSVEGAEQKAISYQCAKCDYVEFEEKSSAKVVKELKYRETPLKIRQKIIKLSQDRLGMYFNKSIVESLDLKAGEEVQVSVPDKWHIILRINKPA
jgi:predicted nucleic-acid-binding Zn-ribbon protein